MPAVVSLFLPGIVLRGADTLAELQLTAKETLVKLEVEVSGPGPYVAVLADASGKEIFRQDGIVPSDDSIRVWLSAEALPDGAVELLLSSKDVEERRRFRVSRTGAQLPSTTKPAQ